MSKCSHSGPNSNKGPSPSIFLKCCRHSKNAFPDTLTTWSISKRKIVQDTTLARNAHAIRIPPSGFDDSNLTSGDWRVDGSAPDGFAKRLLKRTVTFISVLNAHKWVCVRNSAPGSDIQATWAYSNSEEPDRPNLTGSTAGNRNVSTPSGSTHWRLVLMPQKVPLALL